MAIVRTYLALQWTRLLHRIHVATAPPLIPGLDMSKQQRIDRQQIVREIVSHTVNQVSDIYMGDLAADMHTAEVFATLMEMAENLGA